MKYLGIDLTKKVENFNLRITDEKPEEDTINRKTSNAHELEEYLNVHTTQSDLLWKETNAVLSKFQW